MSQPPTPDPDDFADLLGRLFGAPAEPKNPFLARLRPDNRLWLAKITREAREREGR